MSNDTLFLLLFLIAAVVTMYALSLAMKIRKIKGVLREMSYLDGATASYYRLLLLMLADDAHLSAVYQHYVERRNDQ